MATIAGSQFIATAPGQPVNVVETTTGIGLPSTVPGAFNLEVFVGGIPGIAPGYQGLAVLSPSGLNLDLVSGQYAITDNGAGNDTLSVFGSGETVIGGASGVTVNLFAAGETAQGGSGPDTINAFGNSDSVTGGTGSDTINAFGSFDTVNAGAGSDTINVFGAGDTVTSGASTGSNQSAINLFGAPATLADGPHQYSDTVVGFDQAGGDRIHLTGTDTAAFAVANSTQVNAGADTLITLNDGSTILLKGVAHIDSTFFS
jgi:Ca2+-binding RTX toxin-like protein